MICFFSYFFPFYILLLSFFWVDIAGKLFANEYYHIDDVSGKVFILKPWNYYWDRVRSRQNLPRDSIIQMMEGSKVNLRYRYKYRGVARNIQFFLKDAALFRLDRSSLTAIQNKRFYFINNPMDQPGNFLSFMNQSFTLKLKDAWNRVSALHYLRSGSVARNQLEAYRKALGQFSSYALERKKKINIIMPYNLASYQSEKPPFSVWAYWRDANKITAEKKLIYLLYLWRPGQNRGRYRYLSYRKEFILPVPLAGRWFFQVESIDKNYSSSPVMFQVGLISQSKGKDVRLSESIMPIAPKNKSFFYTSNKYMDVDFRWVFSDKPKATISFFLKEKQDDHFRKIEVLNDKISLKLPMGRWQWFVRYSDYSGPGSVHVDELTSPVNGFSINKLTGIKNIVSETIRSGKSGIHYLPTVTIEK